MADRAILQENNWGNKKTRKMLDEEKYCFIFLFYLKALLLKKTVTLPLTGTKDMNIKREKDTKIMRNKDMNMMRDKRAWTWQTGQETLPAWCLTLGRWWDSRWRVSPGMSACAAACSPEQQQIHFKIQFKGVSKNSLYIWSKLGFLL